MQALEHIHVQIDFWLETEQGATAPLISPWPTKLLMFGGDMQSDQLHVPARRTVDFGFSMRLFALRTLTFRPVSYSLPYMFLSSVGNLREVCSFGSLRLARWPDIELVREPSCVVLVWH